MSRSLCVISYIVSDEWRKEKGKRNVAFSHRSPTNSPIKHFDGKHPSQRFRYFTFNWSCVFFFSQWIVGCHSWYEYNIRINTVSTRHLEQIQSHFRVFAIFIFFVIYFYHFYSSHFFCRLCSLLLLSIYNLPYSTTFLRFARFLYTLSISIIPLLLPTKNEYE